MGQFASPWPFTRWCGSNCILSPCLWFCLLEQPLYLKIWTTVQNIPRCFHIEFWEYFSVGLLADIMDIVPDGMYYAHLVENIFDLLVSTFINKKRNFFLQEHWEQISFVTNFNILGFGQPFFPADCRQSGKEWLNLFLCKPFVSGTFLNYLCFWSFSCPLWPQKDLVPDTLSLFTGTSLFSLMVWIWAFCAASWITPIFPYGLTTYRTYVQTFCHRVGQFYQNTQPAAKKVRSL